MMSISQGNTNQSFTKAQPKINKIRTNKTINLPIDRQSLIRLRQLLNTYSLSRTRTIRGSLCVVLRPRIKILGYQAQTLVTHWDVIRVLMVLMLNNRRNQLKVMYLCLGRSPFKKRNLEVLVLLGSSKTKIRNLHKRKDWGPITHFLISSLSNSQKTRSWKQRSNTN